MSKILTIKFFTIFINKYYDFAATNSILKYKSSLIFKFLVLNSA